MKLLVSPTDEQEALEAIRGGADIIDVKNPREGSLGASFPWIIRRIREITPRDIEVSAAIGDLPYLPGTASLAALGAALSGANYVKVGLLGVRSPDDAVFMMRQVRKAAKECGDQIKVVTAGYADATRVGSLDPSLIPEVAHRSGSDIAMIDTAVKDGRGLFDFMDVGRVKGFIEAAHERGLLAAIAGSLGREDIPVIYGLGADIVGVRSAVCDGDRISGRVRAEKVRELSDLIRELRRGFNHRTGRGFPL
ncbi:TPA: (5-formylfuran-3-yl)methyl phosphate synthase [Candidatus Bathyarchaeota archaeon]|nr:(5-formylfuran-3-yl)methyl phosphate synthase [Candidatus Bathyarchaeota archaeon]